MRPWRGFRFFLQIIFTSYFEFVSHLVPTTNVRRLALANTTWWVKPSRNRLQSVLDTANRVIDSAQQQNAPVMALDDPYFVLEVVAGANCAGETRLIMEGVSLQYCAIVNCYHRST